MRTVEEVMVRDVVAIPPSASFVDAANTMRDAKVGMLPIIEDDHLRAVVTDRDLVVRGIARNMDVASARAIECATAEPIAARPDWDVDEALDVMAREQVGRLPVTDDDGRLVGVVTLGSLVLRGEHDERALETAKEVSRRSAKQAAAGPVAKGRAAETRSKGKTATPRRVKRAS